MVQQNTAEVLCAYVIDDLVNLIRCVRTRAYCILVYILTKAVHIFSTVVQDGFFTFFLFHDLAELYLEGVQKKSFHLVEYISGQTLWTLNVKVDCHEPR